jgi:hypothetical protein
MAILGRLREEELGEKIGYIFRIHKSLLIKTFFILYGFGHAIEKI